MIKKITVLFYAAVITCLAASAQPETYSVANAHSHNDYENTVPFYTAYNAQFGSIEADIFLQNGELIVAHDSIELKKHRTLDKYYLTPLFYAVQKNNGHAYPDTTKQLQMLIDIKSDSINTLNKLIDILKQIPLLSNNKSIKWVITGNRPAPSLFITYPSFISFDGELYKNYSMQALTRIVMLSDDFRNYSQWNGNNIIALKDRSVLETAISKAHQLHKPVRFWDAPDNKNTWKQFMQLKVDFINTDRINELAGFLNKK
ncbi:MAG: phosphatidylinositol-specific phospholipase C/glycerophosphodiester phosphodiesterase family protein [Bacteroidetes bacterium]|nr:phosphatidylinositol-specific phospholipase C/glycerophosphodiester phosphodiesterase family protein [Bacteroidota bacterium]